MQGLIVAAGQGARLRDIAASKPLARVNGVALIERVIANARAGGVESFVVVTGYEGERVETFLSELAEREALAVLTVRNPDWSRANGLSVVAAATKLEERFVLMMADHLLEPSIIADLIAQPVVADGLVLAVDRRLDNPLVDLADVTRVRAGAGGRITAIGKGLELYDAFDTGVFLASHSLVTAIEADVAAGGVGGISEGVRRLAAEGLARTFDIGDRFWLDVDDQVAHRHAERSHA